MIMILGMKYKKVSPKSNAVRFYVEKKGLDSKYERIVNWSIALSKPPSSRHVTIDIERFYVDVSHRRNGHGVVIFKILKKLYRHGTFKVESPTAIGIKFYKKLGFKKSITGTLEYVQV